MTAHLGPHSKSVAQRQQRHAAEYQCQNSMRNMNEISMPDRSCTALTKTASGTVGQLGWKICDCMTKKEERREEFQVEANEKDGPEDADESRNSKRGQYDW